MATKAQFWHKIRGGKVAGDPCYRDCLIRPGEAGWCRQRTNHKGTLQADAYGIVGTAVKLWQPYFYWHTGQLGVWIGGIGCTSLTASPRRT